MQVAGGAQACFSAPSARAGALPAAAARSRSSRSCRNAAPSAKIHTAFSDHPHDEAASSYGLSAVDQQHDADAEGDSQVGPRWRGVTAGREVSRPRGSAPAPGTPRSQPEEGRDDHDDGARRKHRQRVSPTLDQRPGRSASRSALNAAAGPAATRCQLKPHVQLHQDKKRPGQGPVAPLEPPPDVLHATHATHRRTACPSSHGRPPSSPGRRRATLAADAAGVPPPRTLDPYRRGHLPPAPTSRWRRTMFRVRSVPQTDASTRPWPTWRVVLIRIWAGLLTVVMLLWAQWVLRLGSAADGQHFMYAGSSVFKLLSLGGAAWVMWTGGRSVAAYWMIGVGQVVWAVTSVVGAPARRPTPAGPAAVPAAVLRAAGAASTRPQGPAATPVPSRRAPLRGGRGVRARRWSPKPGWSRNETQLAVGAVSTPSPSTSPSGR